MPLLLTKMHYITFLKGKQKATGMISACILGNPEYNATLSHLQIGDQHHVETSSHENSIIN